MRFYVNMKLCYYDIDVTLYEPRAYDFVDFVGGSKKMKRSWFCINIIYSFGKIWFQDLYLCV